MFEAKTLVADPTPPSIKRTVPEAGTHALSVSKHSLAPPASRLQPVNSLTCALDVLQTDISEAHC